MYFIVPVPFVEEADTFTVSPSSISDLLSEIVAAKAFAFLTILKVVVPDLPAYPPIPVTTTPAVPTLILL